MAILPGDLDWEMKFRALYAIGKCQIIPISLWQEQEPGFKAYLQGIDIKEGAILKSTSATGKNISTAIENLWEECVNPKTCLVRNAFGSNRTTIRWNGFMWEEKPDHV